MSNLLNKVRTLVLSGELAPGERLTEIGLSEKLGVSRTPVRNVLPALKAEGLLEVTGKRGFSVKRFSAEESVEALELRAALEGMAASNLARKGASAETLQVLTDCLEQGDRLFQNQSFGEEECELFGEINMTFHETIIRAGGSDILLSFFERLNNVPFISPSTIVFEKGADVYGLLYKAHGQHHDILEAIKEGDAARAENLFREHAHGQRTSMFRTAIKKEALSKADSL